MPRELIETYVHKTVARQRPGVSLKLLTSQNLFSSNTVDPGTNLLLRTLTEHVTPGVERCLDIGCGYGPIGASLVTSGMANSVEMVDRDALAVEFAEQNVSINGLENADVYPSLGLDDVKRNDYDLIVSNLPGKAGEQVLRRLLEDSLRHLNDSGQVWIVVVTPLRPFIESSLLEIGAETIQVRHGNRHSVYGYRSAEPATSTPGESDSMAVGVYSRGSVEFEVGRRSIRMETSRGVEEFDGLSYSNRLLLEQMYTVRNMHVDFAALFNVSQGYLPVAVSAAGMTRHVDLVDRDLLALRTTSRNITENGQDRLELQLNHCVDWVPPGNRTYGIIAGALRGTEPREAIEIGARTVCDRLDAQGIGFIAGASTAITRMTKALSARKDVHILDRQRYRGSSVVAFQKQA